MADVTLASIRIWLTQQHNLLQRLMEDANALAALQGQSPFPLTLPANHTVMKRRRKPPAQYEPSTNGSSKTTRKAKGKKPDTSYKRKPEIGQRAEDYVTRVLAEARKPISLQTLTDGMLASGWTTVSAAPRTVVSQALYTLRAQKKLKQFGRKPNRLWGFTNWKGAVKAARAYAAANGGADAT
jgi:hypothetical protein